jgi:hypothetical protein
LDELVDEIESQQQKEDKAESTKQDSQNEALATPLPNASDPADSTVLDLLPKPSPPTTVSSHHSRAVDKEPLFYNLKWIRFQGKHLPVVLQNENGPCPLISLCNILFLRQDLKLKPNQELISNEKLVELLADTLFNHFLPLRSARQPAASASSRNVEIILNDTLGVIQKLQYGMDVNVKFTTCSSFEYTPELDAFDLFFVNLYHGWLIDPEQKEMHENLAEKSYNQLIEMMIAGDDFTKLLADSFLESTASQMTYHGLASLHAVLKHDELAILFRNNHFSTIYKNPGTNQLYLLVTDSGFLTHEEIVWETLDNIDNDGRFCNSDFVEIGGSGSTTAATVESHSRVLSDEKTDTTNE